MNPKKEETLLTFEQGEALRKYLNLSDTAFSEALGFSNMAWQQTRLRRKVSVGMSTAMRYRFGRQLKELRDSLV